MTSGLVIYDTSQPHMWSVAMDLTWGGSKSSCQIRWLRGTFHMQSPNTEASKFRLGPSLLLAKEYIKWIHLQDLTNYLIEYPQYVVISSFFFLFHTWVLF